MYLIFTRMPAESFCRGFRSLVICVMFLRANFDFFFLSFLLLIKEMLFVSDPTRMPSSHWSHSCWKQSCPVSADRPSKCCEPGLCPMPPSVKRLTTWSRWSKAPVWTGVARPTTCSSTTRTRSHTEPGSCWHSSEERQTCDMLLYHSPS